METEKIVKDEVIAESKKLGFGLPSQLPQIENGKLNYYISGSLAMLLLSSAANVTPCTINDKDEIVNLGKKEAITAAQKQALYAGVRKMGGDLDAVAVALDAIPYNGKMQKDLGVDMKKLSTSIFATLAVDDLDETHQISHPNLAILEDEKGNKVVISSPVELVLHKASELIVLLGSVATRTDLKPEHIKTKREKIAKDVADFAAMFNAVSTMELYPKNIADYLANLFNSGSLLTCERIDDNMFGAGVDQFEKATAANINITNKKQFKQFLSILPHMKTTYLQAKTV